MRKITFISIPLLIIIFIILFNNYRVKQSEAVLKEYNLTYDEKGIIIEPKYEKSEIQNENVKIKESKKEIDELISNLKAKLPIQSTISKTEAKNIMSMALSQLYYYPDNYKERYYNARFADWDKKRDPIRENPYGYNNTGDVIKYTVNKAEEWCSDFISWIYYKVKIPMTGSIYLQWDWSLRNVPSMIWYFQEYKTWVDFEDLPEDVELMPGDYISFDYSHSAMVWEVNGDDLHIIEGNIAAQVNERWLKNYKTHKDITGFGLRHGFQRVVSHNDRVDTVASIFTNSDTSRDISEVLDSDLDSYYKVDLTKEESSKVYIDLKKNYIIRRIVFSLNQDKESKLRLSFSNDNKEYEEETQWFNIDKEDDLFSIYLLPQDYRYICIEFDSEEELNNINLEEIFVLD